MSRFTHRACVLVLLAVVTIEARAQGKLSKANYILVWADDFNYASTAQLMAGAKWKINDAPFDPVHSTSAYTPDNVSFCDGIMYLKAAKATDAARYGGYAYTGGGLELKADIDPQDGPCDWEPARWMHGLEFGMVEVRCKLPHTPGVSPAVWLVNPDTELDLIDNGNTPNTRWSSGIVDWRLRNAMPPATFAKSRMEDWSCGGQALKDADANGAQTLSQDFNTYTLVWTRNKLTVFLNGREQYTVLPARTGAPISQIEWDWTTKPSHEARGCRAGALHRNGYRCPATIRLALSTTGDRQAGSYPDSVTEAGVVMAIDYVRIYKPRQGENAASADAYYVNAREYRSYRVRRNNNTERVKPVPGAIAVRPDAAGELVFRGTNNILYRSQQTARDQWQTAAVDNDQGAHPRWVVDGDVNLHPAYQLVTFRGCDSHFQWYGLPNNLADPARHGWLDSAATTAMQPLGTPRTTTVAADGTLYYIGCDHRVQAYSLDTLRHRWQHRWLTPAADSAGRAVGNLALTERGWQSGQLYYKGEDARVHCIEYLGGYCLRQRLGGTAVADTPGALAAGPVGNVFYIGQDGALHRFYALASGGWGHETIATLATVVPSALTPVPAVPLWACQPHPQGALAWDAAGQQLLYVGRDGRLQSLVNARPNTHRPGTWANRWIDDFFNTTAYLAAPRAAPAGALPAADTPAVLAAGPGGEIFYHSLAADELRCFRKVEAQLVNPDCFDPAMSVQ